MTGGGELWDRVQQRFDRLKGAGEAYDPPAWRMIASMMERARGLPEGARDRLAERAQQRMTAFEKESFEASGRARDTIDEVHRRGGDPDDALTAFEEGRFKAALRFARGALLDAGPARDPRARAKLDRMAKEARSRGARLPGTLERDLKAVVDGKKSIPPPELSSALSATLFRQSAAAMRAVVTAARAAENLPESVGPYNTLVLSAKALEQLSDLSPGYLRAFVQRMEALGALQKLPDPARNQPADKQPRTRKGGRGSVDKKRKNSTVKLLPKSEEQTGTKRRRKKPAGKAAAAPAVGQKAPARTTTKAPPQKGPSKPAPKRAPKKKAGSE